MRKFYKCLLICAIAGIALTVQGLALGGAKYSIYADLSGVHITEPGQQTHINEKNLESFTAIDVEADFFDVSIINSDKYGLEMRYTESESNPSWRVDNGVLKISDYSEEQSLFRGIKIFNFDIGSASSSKSNYINVYIPNNATLDSVIITGASGKTVMEGFRAEQVSINNNFGDIRLKNIISSDLDIRLNSGKFDGTDLEAGNIVLKNSFGDCTFDKIEADSLIANLNSGKFEINNSSVDVLELKNSFGNIRADKIVVIDSDIRIESGDVRLSGDLTGKTDIDSRFGNINLNLRKDEAYYALDVSTDFGDTKINGEKVRGSTTNATGRGNLLRVKNTSGDIDINFGKK